MKIAYVIEDFYIGGGVERIISEKANIMSAQWGHDITLISIYRDTPRQTYRLDNNVKLLFLNVPMAAKSSSKTIKAFSRITTLARAAVKLNSALAQINPDIIFFATTLSALLLPLCNIRAKKVFESHSARMFTPYSRLFGMMERRADAVVCLTQDDAREYKGARRVEVIPNFVDNPGKHIDNYAVKKAIAVGRLEHVKGFDMLIDCWKEVAKAHPDWQLDIYGEGSLHEELQRQITRCGLEGRVVLRGRCENMTEAYTGHSLHIMSSRYEGQPMTLIEAQACGLPSVVFNFNYGAKDIVSNGYNGIIVPQNDLNALSGAIVQMAGDEALRAKYGANARLTADRFDRDRIMEKWRQLINRLCAE